MSKYRLQMANILVQQFLRMSTKIKKLFGGLSAVTDYNQSFSAFWRKSSQSEKLKPSRMGHQSVQVSVWTLDLLDTKHENLLSKKSFFFFKLFKTKPKKTKY